MSKKDFHSPASNNDQKESRQLPPKRTPWFHSLFLIALTALLLRLAVITVGHTYRITPRRDHFQFGWEMGRLARSMATGHGFSSPTDLDSGPSAWAPPLYPFILSVDFKIFGVYSAASAWVILAFNSIFGSLTCVTLYKIGQRIFGAAVARWAAWTWALFPYAIYWPTRVVWETSLSAFLLSLALLLTLRMADAAPRAQDWAGYGLLWGVIALTNTALLSMFPFFVLWLIFRLSFDKSSGRTLSHRSAPDQSFGVSPGAQVLGIALCVSTMCLVITPWLVRNYQVFGRFVFIRDNLPLEMHEANNDQSAGLWTRNEHPGNDPEAMRRFQELGETRYMEEKHQQVQQFIHQHPGRFARFTLERIWYFWAAPPQATIVDGYDLIIARHTEFVLATVLAFGGLWLTIRKGKPGGFLLACFLLVYPVPYYLVNPFVRYKHPIEPVMVLLIMYLFAEAQQITVREPFKLRRP